MIFFTTNLLLSLLVKQFVKSVNILTKLEAISLTVSHALCALALLKAESAYDRFYVRHKEIVVVNWRSSATSRALDFAISRSRVQILLEATLRNNLGQVVYTYVPLSQYNFCFCIVSRILLFSFTFSKKDFSVDENILMVCLVNEVRYSQFLLLTKWHRSNNNQPCQPCQQHILLPD